MASTTSSTISSVSATQHAISVPELVGIIAKHVREEDHLYSNGEMRNFALTCKMFWEVCRPLLHITGAAILQQLPVELRKPNMFIEDVTSPNLGIPDTLSDAQMQPFRTYRPPSATLIIKHRRMSNEDFLAMSYFPQIASLPAFNILRHIELHAAWIQLDGLGTLLQPALEVLILYPVGGTREKWTQLLTRVAEKCPNLKRFDRIDVRGAENDSIAEPIARHILKKCQKLHFLKVEPLLVDETWVWEALEAAPTLEHLEFSVPGRPTSGTSGLPRSFTFQHLRALRMMPRRSDVKMLDTVNLTLSCYAPNLSELAVSTTSLGRLCSALPVFRDRWSSTLQVLDIWIMENRNEGGAPIDMGRDFWSPLFQLAKITEFGTRMFHHNLSDQAIICITRAWPNLHRLELSAQLSIHDGFRHRAGRAALYSIVKAYPNLTWLSLPVNWDLPFEETSEDGSNLSCPRVFAWDWADSNSADFSIVRDFLRRHFPGVRAVCGLDKEKLLDKLCGDLGINPARLYIRDWEYVSTY